MLSKGTMMVAVGILGIAVTLVLLILYIASTIRKRKDAGRDDENIENSNFLQGSEVVKSDWNLNRNTKTTEIIEQKDTINLCSDTEVLNVTEGQETEGLGRNIAKETEILK